MQDHSSASISDVWEYHPQLKEKMVVDLVNGIEIARDHLRCKALGRPLVAQCWQIITGHEARQQYAIDVNLTTGLETVVSWLQDLQAFQADSDLAIAATARKLIEVRNLLSGELTSLKDHMSSAIDAANNRLDHLTERIAIVEARNHAHSELSVTIQRISASECHLRPFIAQICFAVDRLWWGQYGLYCRLLADETELRNEFEIASFKIGEMIARSYSISARGLLSLQAELEPLANMDMQDRQALAFSPRVLRPCRIPIFNAISRAAGDDASGAYLDAWLPQVVSPIGLCMRLFHESRRFSECLR